MSAPSRRPEIRRRRTRNEKIAKLKKRHTAATTEADRTRHRGQTAPHGPEFSGATLVKRLDPAVPDGSQELAARGK